MAKGTEQIACRNPHDILRLLQGCLGSRQALPPSVGRVGDDWWTLPLESFPMEVPELEKRAGAVRVPIEIGNGRVDRQAELAEVIGLSLKRVDPIADRLQRGPARSAGRDGLNPGAAARDSRRYILRAAEGEGAAALLDTLTKFLTPRIEAVPILNSRGNGESVYWSVAGEVPLTVLRAAGEVWWGHVQSDRREIYYQWPFRLPEGTESLLKRVDWDVEGRAAVLVNVDPPHKTVIELGDRAGLRPLIDLSELTLDSAGEVELQHGSDGGGRVFPVRVRLVDRPEPERMVGQRLAELKTQIDYLEKLHEQLDGLFPDADLDAITYEPLYVYRDAADASVVPLELRRLLMEWSDQESDLKRLRYQKIDGRSLDPLGESEDTAHLLTTDVALRAGKPPPADTLPARLRSYEPTGNFTRFSLVPSWARHGLRLFVPHTRHRWQMSLYPDAPPGPMASQKLAEALGIAGDEPNWCVLLVPHGRDGVHACKVRIPHAGADGRGFQPIVTAIPWACSIDVNTAEQTTVYRHGVSAAGTLVSGIRRAMSDAAESETDRLLEQLDRDLAQFEEERDQRRAVSDRIEAALDELGPMHERANTRIEGVEEQLQVLTERYSRMTTLNSDVSAASTSADQIKRLVEELAELRAHHERMSGIYREFHAEMEVLKNGTGRQQS